MMKIPGSPSAATAALAASLSLAAAVTVAGRARADLLAAYDHPTTSNGMDIGLVDLSTGSQLAVPPGVNLGGNETHPELSGDGSILVFQRGSLIVRYDLRHNTSTTIAPPFGADGFTTPGISPDGTRLIYGQAASFDDVGAGTTNQARATVRVASTLEPSVPPIPTLGPSDPSPACNLSGVQGLPGDGTVDASIDNGSSPMMAWMTGASFGYQIDVAQFTADHFTGCLTESITAIATSPSEPTARFGGVTFAQTSPSQNRDLRTFVPGQGVGSFPAGSISDPAAINTVADENMPSWSADGRYLGFLRMPSQNETVIEIYDEQSQRLVNPAGIAITVPNNNVFGVGGHLSIALDPTIFHIVCTRINTFNQVCFQSSAGPTGALIMRIVGTHHIPTVLGGKLRVRTVPRLRQVGIVVLGRKARRFHVRLSALRVHGKPLARGHYLIFIRARTNSLKLVRDISQAIPFTIK